MLFRIDEANGSPAYAAAEGPGGMEFSPLVQQSSHRRLGHCAELRTDKNGDNSGRFARMY